MICTKRWGWSKVRQPKPRDMLKAVTTLPGSDTGFLHRVFGNIRPSIVALQNVLLTLAHPRYSCGSYHMKRAKVNISRQLSLSPYKQLKHVNCRSWKARQSALIVEKMSSLQRDPSPFHIPTEPAAWPSKHLLRRWQFRCQDWNGVKPCTELRFGTRRNRICSGKSKALQAHNLQSLADTQFSACKSQWLEWLRLKSKCNSGRMMLVHHNSEKGSDQNTGLKSEIS